MKMKLKFYGDSKDHKICDRGDVDFKSAYEGRYFDIYEYEPEVADYEVTKEAHIFYTTGGRTFKAHGWYVPNNIYETWKLSNGKFEVLKVDLNDANRLGMAQIRDEFAQFNECELVYLKVLKVPKWFCHEYFD